MTSMLNARINLKLEREAKQKKELQEWIVQEKEARMKLRFIYEHQCQEEERQRQLRLEKYKEGLLRERPTQLPSDNSVCEVNK